VLKEMGKTAAALGLETETNFLIDADGDDRGGSVRRDDFLETIGEGDCFDGYVHSGGSLNARNAASISVQS